ncbi:hypothetical protein ES703_52010 [subsurface metagenome]
MAEWQVVAEGTNIRDLESTVGEMELPKGSKLLVVMDLKLPLGFLFDIAGAELLFKPFVPDGMDLIDVYGEGSQGFVEMEADPAWLLAVLAFVKAHWLAITIATFVLAAIIAAIIVLVKIAVAPALPIAAIAIGGGLALLGIVLLSRRREKVTPVT